MGTLPMPFSNPYDYGGRHTGVDFAQPRGTVIRASGRGRMAGHSRSEFGGWIGWVEYDVYRWGIGHAHQDGYGMMPRVGEDLVYGDIIGAVGNSGRSTGPHLHIENSGNPTPAGIWAVYDRTRWVGQGGGSGGGGNTGGGGSSVIALLKKDEEMDFFYLQGKVGSHNAGLFGVYRGNADGKLYARRLTSGTNGTGFPTMPAEALPQLQAAMPFIGL